MRIGITGTENSHAEHFIRILNAEGAHPGVRVTALSGGRSERNLQLAEQGGIDVLVERPQDLLGHVDAVIITDRNGALHPAQAIYFLDNGVPTFVDKPLATSLEDARRVVRAAARSGTPLASFSAMRFVPPVVALADEMRGWETVSRVEISGPASVDSEHSGLFFYGIHCVEIALQLLAPVGATLIPANVAVVDLPGERRLTANIAETAVQVRFLSPDVHGHTPFRIDVQGEQGWAQREIVPDSDYLVPTVERFIAVLSGQTPPQREATLLAPVALIELAQNAR
ncbi:Gfo/Idh/MocA family protein [Microbacterium esteraromaticum]|uniref:Gfo/Idh/MocA family protein n=1 Tax=Microbacterium esteraromaticum TaxID=57043 RepID=UPI0019D400B5|nr:Gfo/Idh/MocA family oxidoreductase [Microbacterium esteraromaticum]MBN7793865.1 Gfo/Idh/MocA family oxidoreductase [Microbacterium esteraromaticum]